MFLQPSYHWLLALSAATFYFFPSRELTVIGVTGTDGKSTVVSLLHEILRKSGHSVASISSLRFKINDGEEPNLRKMTMPGRFFVQRFLQRAQKSGAEFVILEVTSEGIKQFRHKFIKFDAAVLTNLTPEHIESHGSFENYRAAKAKLFRALGKNGVAILNRDDSSWEYFAVKSRAKTIFYSTKGITVGGRMHPVSALSTKDGIAFVIDGVRFRSELIGGFNVSNILAASSAAYAFGLTFEEIAQALEKIPPVPGRLEVIQEKPFRVVVDYAHTPNALRNVYQTLRNLQPTTYNLQPRLICVLGAAGGGRDRWKRPELGKIAGEFCGEIILTNEDPYDEPPHEIIEQVAAGAGRRVEKILDRREAIRKALHIARAGDIVIITGKGAEQWTMGPNNTKIPWDDRRVTKEELARPRF
ncbi:MAG: UDP-N-acetylmuramoyl-L-alanyl-D-glutamate--2,6-diaminopimelate ligase [Candidatus Sungiibacteriota bacterium]